LGWVCSFGVVVGEELAQAVEAALPAGAALSDPVLDGFEGGGLDAARADAADLAGVDEAAGFEHLEVLHDGWEGHGEGLSELGDGGGTKAEAFDHAATGGIGEGVEQAVERRALVKHRLNYDTPRAISQVSS
jgi:hypothetical protein